MNKMPRRLSVRGVLIVVLVVVGLFLLLSPTKVQSVAWTPQPEGASPTCRMPATAMTHRSPRFAGTPTDCISAR
ncbi:hypothetical protein [Pseudomonas sp. 6D_7.1_Bac1]|jgi:hypothetical protein|uniref:hypothetical protein n=1 Tax=Pseudomonas sp. 6D_7.1_Bac1 TaxID=2971615 RepID=UPI003965A5D6